MKEIILEKKILNVIQFSEYPIWISMIIAIYISLLLATYLFVGTIFNNINIVNSQQTSVIKTEVIGQYNNFNNAFLTPENFFNNTYLLPYRQSNNIIFIVSEKEKKKIIANIKDKQEKRRLELLQKQYQSHFILNRYSIITAYSSDVYQCDDTPCITANGFNVCQHGKMDTIATNYLEFGTKVKIPDIFGDKIFVVRDRMNKRYNNRIDIWMTNKYDAKKFGVKKSIIYIKPVKPSSVFFE